MTGEAAEQLPDPEVRAHRVGKALREQADRIADLELQLAALREDVATARRLAAEHVGRAATTEAERDHALRHAHMLRDAAAELDAIQRTKLMRWSAAPRRLYSKVRALASGRRR